MRYAAIIYASILVWVFPQQGMAQWILKERKAPPVVGTSLTYIFDFADPVASFPEGYIYHEYTWSVNLAMDLNRRFRIGLENKTLLTRSPLSGKNTYFMAGVFGQYDFLTQRKGGFRFFPELSFHYGNHCTCEPDDPHRVDGLYYIGFGLGLNWPVSKRMLLDFAFNNHEILNKHPYKYNYTQYIIGIDYRLSRTPLKTKN